MCSTNAFDPMLSLNSTYSSFPTTKSVVSEVILPIEEVYVGTIEMIDKVIDAIAARARLEHWTDQMFIIYVALNQLIERRSRKRRGGNFLFVANFNLS